MPKDLKTGLVIGLVVEVAIALWLSTRESLSIKSRMFKAEFEAEPRYVADLPVNNSVEHNEGTVDPEEGEQTRPAVPRIHAVGRGETLSEISYKYYGTSTKWQKILIANRTIIKDVKNLRPGMRLIIPE